MSHPNASTALARVIVDELSNRGVSYILISPGSRSGALAIAASQHPDIETRVIIDERSAAFHALGAGRASGGPVVAISTSGSAPANFFPAIVEADMSCVPLVVISADRPAELQGVGTNQTIDQVEMFGSKVRAYAGIEAPDSRDDRNSEWRMTVTRLVSSATGTRPGPAHLNVRFREPTVPVTHDGRSRGEEYVFPTDRIVIRAGPQEETPDELPSLEGRRGVVIAGDGVYDRDALSTRAKELGWPVLATALSGMRGTDVVSTYHHVLAKGVPDSLRPETVVAVGAVGPSPRVETLVASAEERVRIDVWGRHIDPGRNATHVLRGDVVDLLADVAATLDDSWMTAWKEAGEAARARLESVLDDQEGMTGAMVASVLNEVDWGSLVVASSLPIREVDAHLRRPGPVFANRGASGIDGFVSTALGVASRHPRTLAVTGDLSLLHDSNGLLHEGPIDLTIVVMDNEGGGLFDSLPQASHAPSYERLFVTNPARDLEFLVHLHHLRYAEAHDRHTLLELTSAALDRPGTDLIRVPIDRAHDLTVTAQLDG